MQPQYHAALNMIEGFRRGELGLPGPTAITVLYSPHTGKSLARRVAKHWNKLPREAVGPPLLEMTINDKRKAVEAFER